jgi:hypothetical protein
MLSIFPSKDLNHSRRRGAERKEDKNYVFHVERCILSAAP